MIKILSHYAFKDNVKDIKPYGNGNINKTYLVETGSDDKYILQEINTKVFKKPKEVMKNIEMVTNHIRNTHIENNLSSDNAVLEIVYTNKNDSYVKINNQYWRAYKFVNNAETYETTENPDLFKQVGIAIGAFQKFLNDFDPNKLSVTIPDFHNTPKRYGALSEAIELDKYNRAIDVFHEIKFIYDRKDRLSIITDALDNHEIPIRVSHNDTKLNNVMIDKTTKKAVCIIDLDTVMPGSVLYDFGDAIRIGASASNEDESDLSKIKLDLPLFEAFTEGFLSEMSEILTDTEKKLLVDSVWVITMEITIRFLTDYLNNDQYFRIDYPKHNLTRVYAQMKLVEEIELCRDKMIAFIDSVK